MLLSFSEYPQLLPGSIYEPMIHLFLNDILRYTMKLLQVIFLGVNFMTAFCSGSNQSPNIILLLADDLGYSDLSCYGSQDVKTPNIDKLASKGMMFTHFYAGSAVCSPSRASLLTGRFSLRAGVYSWIDPSQNMHLRREEQTIAEVLQSKGFDTAHIGKWHLGYQLEKNSGNQPNPGDQGFDFWMATGNNANPSHQNPNNFVKNGVAVGETKGYSCQLVVDEAIQWLQNRTSKKSPFYLNLWFHEPHAKVAAPARFRNRHLDKNNPDYYGCIENMDYEIGRLMSKVKEIGVQDNTAIIFTSDNGSYMKGSNGSLTGRKTQLWEGGIREPGIFIWPGKIRQGTQSSQPAGVVDILPTICEIVGVATPVDRVIDGASLIPAFYGNEINRRTPLYWFYNPSRPVCVIRENEFCLVADPTIELPKGNMFKESYIGDIKKSKLTNFRLYNLKEDPEQKRDLSILLPDKLNSMKAKMLKTHLSVMAEAHDWRKNPF